MELDLAAAIGRARREQRPIFVHFTADWCAPCRTLKEEVYPAPEVARRLERFVRAEVDIENPDGAAAARRFGVQSVPVLVLLDPRGEEYRNLRVLGALEPPRLASVLDRALARAEASASPRKQ